MSWVLWPLCKVFELEASSFNVYCNRVSSEPTRTGDNSLNFRTVQICTV